MQSSHAQLHQQQQQQQQQMSKHQQQQHLQQAAFHPHHFAAQQQQQQSHHPHHPHQQPPSAEDLTLFTSLAAYADALDALPLDLTRSFSDLRELDAVLGAHITSLTTRLRHLTSLIEDPLVTPGERLVALKEVAEEARAYKMGGEDKIRVAVNTADIIVSHTDYIDSLLDNLNSVSSLSPYIDPVSYLRQAGIIPGPSGDLNFNFPGTSSSAGAGSGVPARGAAAASNAASFSASAVPGYVNGAAPDYMGSLPTKTSRKKVTASSAASSLNHASGANTSSGKARDTSAAGGAASAAGGSSTKKRRPPAGASSASKAARLDEAHSTAVSAAAATAAASSSSRSAPKQASKTAPHAAGSPPGGANVAGGSSSMIAAPSNSSSSSRAMKNAAPSHRDLPDEEEEDVDDEAKQDGFTVSRSGRVSRRPNQGNKGEPNYAPGDEEDVEAGARRMGRQEDVSAGAPTNGPPAGPAISNGNGSASRLRRGSGVKSHPGEGLDAILGAPREGVEGLDPDTGELLYCFCNRVSYGEMIGCDDDHCKREWFHIGCLGLEKPPVGTWYCEDCLERRRKAKKGGKSSGGTSGGRRR